MKWVYNGERDREKEKRLERERDNGFTYMKWVY